MIPGSRFIEKDRLLEDIEHLLDTSTIEQRSVLGWLKGRIDMGFYDWSGGSE